MSEETNIQPTEEPKTTSIAINFLDGGFADFQVIMGYQIQGGVISILTKEGSAELFPINNIQSISITQSE